MSAPLLDLSPLNSILARLEVVADRLERGTGSTEGGSAPAAAPAAAAAQAEEESAIVKSLTAFSKEKVEPVLAAAQSLAVDEVSVNTKVLADVFNLLVDVFRASGKCKKPENADWQAILKPVMEECQKVSKACDNRSPYFQNIKAIAETLNIVMLVTTPAPADHCQNVLESADFHAIKVMQKKNPPETAWIGALKEMLKALKTWCSENCKMGITWNGSGGAAKAYFEAHPLGSKAAAPAPKAKGKGKGAPPPPSGDQRKAPPKFEDMDKPAAKSGGGGGMADVFNEIAKFQGGTGGLKKVSDDMKTKNRAKDDVVSVVKASSGGYAAAKAKAGAGKPKGPPLKELRGEGLKWFIENFDNDKSVVVENAEKNQLVAILNCNNSVIKIDGRVKSVMIDGCNKTAIIVQDVISTLEFVNCERCQCQIIGAVRSVAIDKCNGLNVYLSKDSLEAEITSSKSSEMNINIPNEAGDEFTEVPVPEQFVTKIRKGTSKLHTTVSDIYSA